MQLKGKKINFLGDSITQGVGVSSEEKIYLNLLAQRCGLAQARNYGISGTRIARYEGQEYSAAYTERFAQMDDDADVIVVFGGTNDFGHGNLPLGAMADRENISFYGALHVLICGLIEKYPKATLVFMTPLHRTEETVIPRGDGVELEAYRRAIKEVCTYYAVPVLDLYAVSGIQPLNDINRAVTCPDGLHPNDWGHELMASRLEGFLRSL